jgi:O-antigen ligase
MAALAPPLAREAGADVQLRSIMSVAQATALGAARGFRFLVPAAAVCIGAPALGALAVMRPPLALAFVLGLLFVGVAVLSLPAGVALFVFIVFFERLGSVTGGISLIKLAGAVLVGAWLLRLVTERDALGLSRSHPLVATLLVAFAVWAFASSLWASDSGAATGAALRIGQNVLFVFVLFSAWSNRRGLIWSLWAYVLGAFATAAVGIVSGTPQDTADAYGGVTRIGGTIGDPNYLAAVLVPALVFAAFMLAFTRPPLLRFLLVVAIGTMTLGVFLTGSRGGIIAMVAVFVASLVFGGPVRSRAVMLFLFIGAAGVLYFTLVAPPAALQRVTNFSEGGGSGRTDLWAVSLAMSGDHPLLGVGAGNFTVVEPRYAARNLALTDVNLVLDQPHVAHNTYLEVLTEFGAVGLALFVLLIGSILGLGRRAAREAAAARGRVGELMSRAAVIALVGLFAAYVFLSAQYEKQLWVLLGMALVLPSLVASRAAVGETDTSAIEPDRSRSWDSSSRA